MIIENSTGVFGGIIGDVCGSIYEGRRRNRVTDCPEEIDLYNARCHFTDDTVMTVATMDALLTDRDYARSYREWGRRYPHAGYGKMFKAWFMSDDAGPYGSYGNGALMRVGPIGWAFDDLVEVEEEARRATEVTHNHPYAVEPAVSLARDINKLRGGFLGCEREIDGYNLVPDIIRPLYANPKWEPGVFDISCNGTMEAVYQVSKKCGVPENVYPWEDGEEMRAGAPFERIIQTAISVGGDSDTIACVVGSLFGTQSWPERRLLDFVLDKLPQTMIDVVAAFQRKHATIRR